MPVYKDKDRGTWYLSFYYEDWRGVRQKKMKRGFKTRREALEWEREFLRANKPDMNITFAEFVQIYITEKGKRIRENTWQTKVNVIETKLIPYFGKKKMSDISSKDVIAWQNVMLESCNPKTGKPYASGYLKTIHNQLSAIFNHAVRHYGLPVNPAAQAGNMGKEGTKEMLFWTQEEYKKFAEAIMDRLFAYYSFEMLYWCGLRVGELLALTPADFDFEKQTVSITKSYQRINGEDVITPPKTLKSNRVIQMPEFLCEEIQKYIDAIYGVKPTDRVFTLSKYTLRRELRRGAELAGVKTIRVHDLRHSHVSLLADLDFTPSAIGDRVGHESTVITDRYSHMFPTKQIEMASKLDMVQKEVFGNVS